MAYVLNWSATISWVGDGVGQFQGTQDGAPRLNVSTKFGANSGAIQVPGGDAPSTANVSTACTTAGTNMATALNAAITQIDGWATGITS